VAEGVKERCEAPSDALKAQYIFASGASPRDKKSEAQKAPTARQMLARGEAPVLKKKKKSVSNFS